QTLTELAQLRRSLLHIRRIRVQACRDEIDFDHQIGVLPREVRKPLIGGAGLPGADRALAGGGFHLDRAIGVDAAEAGPVSEVTHRGNLKSFTRTKGLTSRTLRWLPGRCQPGPYA